MRETWVQSLGREDPLEKEMATHFSILAWRIPWTEEPGGLQFMGSERVGHYWVEIQLPTAALCGFRFIHCFWVHVSQFSSISRFQSRKLEGKWKLSFVLPQVPSPPPHHPMKTSLLAFALLHSVLKGQICLLLQVFPDTLLLHSTPLCCFSSFWAISGLKVTSSSGNCQLCYFSLDPLLDTWARYFITCIFSQTASHVFCSFVLCFFSPLFL